MNEDIQELFRDALIDVGKVPGGTTAINQAADASPVFRTCKAGMETITKKAIDVTDTDLQDLIIKAISDLESKNTVPRQSKTLKVSAQHKMKICYAVLRINYVLKNYLKPSHIVEGFTITGQHVFDKNKQLDQPTVSFAHVMNQCYKKLDTEDYEVMQANAEAHIQTYRRTGRLSNEDMDSSNIWTTNELVSRDDRQLSHQGAVLITHADTIARFMDYRQIQLDNKNPEIIAQRKALAVSLRNLRKNILLNSQKEAREEAKKAKEAEKRIETDRIAALTPAERRQYKEDKRLNNIAKRAAKDAERIAQIEQDIAVVGQESADQVIINALMEVGYGDGYDANDGDNDEEEEEEASRR